MSIPQFTAEASLSQRQGHYRMSGGPGFLRTAQVLPQGARIIPSLPPRNGGGGGATCAAYCIDQCDQAGNNPRACLTTCNRVCRAGGAGGPGPSPQPNPVNHALCVGGCWAWWSACTADAAILSLGLGQPFCDTIRDRCLQPCPP